MEYLGLEGGPPGFPRDFSCPMVLWCYRCLLFVVYGTFTLFGLGFPAAHSTKHSDQTMVVHNPNRPKSVGLA